MCLLLILLKLFNISLITSWQEPQQCSVGTSGGWSVQRFSDPVLTCFQTLANNNNKNNNQKKNATQVQVNMSLVARWAQSSICACSEEYASMVRRVFSQPVNGREGERGQSSVPSLQQGLQFLADNSATQLNTLMALSRQDDRMLLTTLYHRVSVRHGKECTLPNNDKGKILEDHSFLKRQREGWEDTRGHFSHYCILSTALTDPHSQRDLCFHTFINRRCSFQFHKGRMLHPCVTVFVTFVPTQQPSLFDVMQHDTTTMHVGQYILHRVLGNTLDNSP